MVLGSRRAENVKESFVVRGLPAERADTTSRGEMEELAPTRTAGRGTARGHRAAD
jgi:outer membrane protein OmpA-like peptidoglycan-associated protein